MSRWNWLGALLIVASACGTTVTGSTNGTTTGNSNEPLGAGSPCSSNDQCDSHICGLAGTGNCCSTQCTGDGTACGISGCDSNGACAKAYAGANCDGCSGSTFTPGSCDGQGTCETGIPHACADRLVCDSAGKACELSCAKSSDCGTGSWCNAGVCTATLAIGACTTNEACTSGVCGVAGMGHCCSAACANTTAPCGATDCEVDGTCVFPPTTTVCGTGSVSCSGGMQSNPSQCDGQGTCAAATSIQCAPYLCGETSCLSGCVDATSCAGGDFCDTINAACCAPLSSGGTLTVDSVNGNDAVGCCGIGSNQPCKTITHAMRIINMTAAENVTIQATVKGGAGDWAPAGERYPIVLGWGVELSAPGVYFMHPNGAGAAGTFRVSVYSEADTLGSASMFGTATANIAVGMNKAQSAQSTALSAIQVDPSATLYIANAYVNGNDTKQTTAITVMPGGTLVLATDQSGDVTGTVNIGNNLNQQGTDGFDGIFCRTDNVSKGCTIKEGTNLGINSLIVQGQDAAAIVAQDFANITLVGTPIFGIDPANEGFNECGSKPDGAALKYPGEIYLAGKVTMLLRNAIIHCVSADGIALAASRKGSPTLTLDKATISNVETALAVTADGGTAIVSNSTFQFNYNGASQGPNSVVDLSGGTDGGTNTIICNSNNESIYSNFTAPGAGVINTSKGPLNAMDVKWDTPGPDQFSCNASLSSCTCLLSSCTGPAAVNGMDAVTEVGGAIITTGNTLETALAHIWGCQ